eukprot:CAMPEP_0185790878 /NCGR_PEP_ID=MMETSP1174-20130828/158052_1 /TAXON_ID=35687 /ORGANISM="Dictyocha speculum, Strain CCMP1381" /LENGTH=58 /DNA_ID=CAMNT_0028485743 /DNA_START=519 /DNA_END=695 /DNA_ORIENTATION=-
MLPPCSGGGMANLDDDDGPVATTGHSTGAVPGVETPWVDTATTGGRSSEEDRTLEITE